MALIKNNKNSRAAKFSCLAVVSFIVMALTACNTEGVAEGLVPQLAPPDPQTLWWNVPTPDFTINDQKPVIELAGARTVLLTLGDTYIDDGATAFDQQDGDLSEQVEIINNVDVTSVGDYFVQDSEGNQAIEQSRLVRVIGQLPTKLTKRAIGTTLSNFGYVEHLPEDYGTDPEKLYPVIIFNHGNGANAERSGDDPLFALDNVAISRGPFDLINQDKWDSELPFIVVSPQYGDVPGKSGIYRLNGFVEYITHTYNIDKRRIYIAGWSQGGFISYQYAATYPEKIAALLTISGSYPFSENEKIPSILCNLNNIPMWLFHGSDDEVVARGNSTSGYNRPIEHCQPTVLPKLSLVVGQGHDIANQIFDLSAMNNGDAGFSYDDRYNSYDISIYQWLLNQVKEFD
ncbi:alpha/beta fold hydrolase [Colwellia sp. MEBiC06753]